MQTVLPGLRRTHEPWSTLCPVLCSPQARWTRTCSWWPGPKLATLIWREVSPTCSLRASCWAARPPAPSWWSCCCRTRTHQEPTSTSTTCEITPRPLFYFITLWFCFAKLALQRIFNCDFFFFFCSRSSNLWSFFPFFRHSRTQPIAGLPNSNTPKTPWGQNVCQQFCWRKIFFSSSFIFKNIYFWVSVF